MTLSDGDWDVLVIGTGIGGGTLGRRLAEAGQRVLFLEKGQADARSAENGLSEIFVPEARAKRGLWPQPLSVEVDGVTQSFYAPLGSGPGGSSVFYAATLERPERHDLEDTPQRPHPTGGWPLGFDALAPFYAEAAQMYRVYGTPDPLSDEAPLPLRDPPALTAVEMALMNRFRARGLHPYHAHTAVERADGCQMCLGRKCPKACKMDGRSAGVEPALATGRAEMLTGAEVTRLVMDGPRVAAVEAVVDGQTRRFTARRYVLAAGALGSPQVLLRSACAGWEVGVANGSGLVGRNLMFHVNEMFALWPRVEGPATKAVSLRDFYHRDGQRLGTVQAMGIRASYGEIVFYLNRMLAAKGWSRLSPFTRLPAALAARMLGSAQIFVGLMEDLPYAENRVEADGRVVYRLSEELKTRRRAFRRAIRRGLGGRFLSVTPELNWGHPCGSLRFGDDPAQSVLRPDGRAHEVDNLWVADASFMPTSMGVNPSLTIAAYALSVAAGLLEHDG
ncbi:choline dehydrogenase-like flavoprotein [Sagittula marina]|uniref:Choline dehydrogenase-like flavoprotein n=1 Tax=Sagittula marina TaxID=943940 RepID=A0A7W6DIV4_9RHOB|nr:GMC family oxidoreductase [Sagittula marina]MBB3983843.1 choline dehydrogenase-like flavoprotein [Sagittula marina]